LEGPPGISAAGAKQVRQFSSGGVAAVWAKSNTREEIYKAIKNKETYATSGPRMKVRVFAGYGFDKNILNSEDWVSTAYSNGVPMGGDLKASSGEVPSLVIHALKEANGANLDRVQVIKGWVDGSGKAHEKIYNVALSDERTVDANGKVAPVGNTVNAKEATYTNDIGATELKTVWIDPDFDASQPAFYYIRVIQIPTPRWSTYDAKKTGIAIPEDLPVSIQERAWSSPIWYSPK
jgi:hypothetical protein